MYYHDTLRNLLNIKYTLFVLCTVGSHQATLKELSRVRHELLKERATRALANEDDQPNPKVGTDVCRSIVMGVAGLLHLDNLVEHSGEL